MTSPRRPTWLEIDLDAIAHNVRLVKDLVGAGTHVMAMVKANAYGHGALPVASAALKGGATWLGVAMLTEGLELRAAGLAAPTLIVGFMPPQLAAEAIANDLALTVYDAELARAYADAARAQGRVARAHLKIDTGMGRLGVLPSDAPSFIEAMQRIAGLSVEGIFTHFSCADTDADFTREQLKIFDAVTTRAPSSVLRHAANSAATLALPETRLDLVRVGIGLYGLNPFDPPSPLGQAWGSRLRPALAWKTTVAQVKTLPDGWPVSYGATYRCDGARVIAALPVGYADGFRRAPTNFSSALVRGQRAPIVGRVCMDQTMIDVTHIPHVAIGDEVVLIGEQRDAGERARISAEDAAASIGSVNYEVTSAILSRVPRIFLNG